MSLKWKYPTNLKYSKSRVQKTVKPSPEPFPVFVNLPHFSGTFILNKIKEDAALKKKLVDVLILYWIHTLWVSQKGNKLNCAFHIYLQMGHLRVSS